jgi:hypothetical protein
MEDKEHEGAQVDSLRTLSHLHVFQTTNLKLLIICEPIAIVLLQENWHWTNTSSEEEKKQRETEETKIHFCGRRKTGHIP